MSDVDTVGAYMQKAVLHENSPGGAVVQTTE